MKRVETNVFDNMVGEFITRNYKYKGLDAFQIFLIEQVDNNILIGELFQSINGQHEARRTLDAFDLKKPKELGFSKSTELDIFTFNIWKGVVDDEEVKRFKTGREFRTAKEAGLEVSDEKKT